MIRPLWRPLAAAAPVWVLALVLQGCAAGSLAGAALDLVGMRKPPELPDAQKPPRQVTIRLHAAANLNADAAGRPLALVARIYKLRQGAAFQQASYQGLLNAQSERELLGGDLLEVKEVLLIPGQRYEVQEKVTREAYVIGVVAQFRAPAGPHWRLAFGAGEAEREGITVGVHACTLSVGAGAAASGAAPAPLSSVHCR